MDESQRRMVGIAVAVAVLAIVVVVIWRVTAPPAPTIGAGQTLQNIGGAAASGPRGVQQQIVQPGPGQPQYLPPGIPPGMGMGPPSGGAPQQGTPPGGVPQ